MPKLLIIDDEESVCYSLRYAFEDENIAVCTGSSGKEGIRCYKEQQPDVVLLDLQLPDCSGLKVFEEIRECDPNCPVIILTAHGTTETAIEAMKNGAFDYLIKPVAVERLGQILSRAFDSVRQVRLAVPPTEAEDGDRIVGSSAVMQEMCKAIGRIAPQDVNVLIVGESGTGKELVARALYQHSSRAGKPFLAINCAAIPETLLESELFGHEEGAFTGASQRRLGKFEQCDGGTLFLDEIGDMAPALQAKMLRVLQDQRFERLGSNQTVQTSVRILAATNQDLESLVAKGLFRKDLYYRLKGACLRVPALRDHREDIPELAHYFLCRFNRRLNRPFRVISPETLKWLQSYSWPGNVRELQSLVKEAMLHGSGPVLLPEFFPKSLPPKKLCPGSVDQGYSLEDLVKSVLDEGGDNLYARVVEAVERVLLPLVLQYTDGHQTQASAILGIGRGTLRQKLRALGLVLDKVLVEENDDSAP